MRIRMLAVAGLLLCTIGCAKNTEEVYTEKAKEYGWSPALARCSLGHEYARGALYGGSVRPSAKEEAARRRLAIRSVELLKSCSAM